VISEKRRQKRRERKAKNKTQKTLAFLVKTAGKWWIPSASPERQLRCGTARDRTLKTEERRANSETERIPEFLAKMGGIWTKGICGTCANNNGGSKCRTPRSGIPGTGERINGRMRRRMLTQR
jgi:hypothetical protein